ncbi:interleukin-18 receptor accessory protein-like isoform X2 [Salvelinus alpinus]|uniref:interleukin-18 receptor accessory protein-like isoform X2 n=1 Tax=Salvelinus alpinus TaxID=8036 RepID=UPI0039FD94DE
MKWCGVMHPGPSLALAIIACFLQRYFCESRGDKEEGLKPGSETYGHKAFSGEGFVMQCTKPQSAGLCERLYNITASSEEADWSRAEGETNRDRDFLRDDGAVTGRGNALWFSTVTAKHSGKYTCHTGGMVIHFYVEVLERASLGCRDTEENRVTLVLGKGGRIPCPGIKCQTQRSEVTWYKDARPVCEIQDERTISVVDRDTLLLGTVYVSDATLYFCDYTCEENGIPWTVRRSVNVSVIPDTKDPPQMTYPHGNEEGVELGEPHNLSCQVQFGFQRTFDPVVQWWISSHSNHEDMMKLMEMEAQEVRERSIEEFEFTVTRTAQIPEVTQLHLDSTFTCLAQNSVGNSSATIRLTRKSAVSRVLVIVCPVMSLLCVSVPRVLVIVCPVMSLLCVSVPRVLVIVCPVMSLLFVAGLGITVHVYWLEISILYRIYLPYKHATTDDKEYDAFVSYVPSSSSEEAGGRGRGGREEALEVLLPRVLEGQWGYRLFLLERDLLPGGAYAEDVVCAIRSSRRLVCVLSPDYLASTCLFELETGIRALQQDPHLRLILIWTSPSTTSPNPSPSPNPSTSSPNPSPSPNPTSPNPSPSPNPSTSSPNPSPSPNPTSPNPSPSPSTSSPNPSPSPNPTSPNPSPSPSTTSPTSSRPLSLPLSHTLGLVAPASLLPPLVRRAIRVLPALHWTPQDQGRMITSSNSGSRFWRSLHKAMPAQSGTGTDTWTLLDRHTDTQDRGTVL